MDWAERDNAAKVRETGGDNRSPRIDALNRFVGNPIGSPYCAAGVSWCFHAAGAMDFPFSGSSQAIKSWFEHRGLLSFQADSMLAWHGALFGWSNGDGLGHIGFVAERLTSDEHVVSFKTVEYNTSLAGSRDGQGVFSLTRHVAEAHQLWFLDTSDFEGGRWWD